MGRIYRQDTLGKKILKQKLYEFPRRHFLSSLCIGRDASNLIMNQWDFQSSEMGIIPLHMLCDWASLTVRKLFHFNCGSMVPREWELDSSFDWCGHSKVAVQTLEIPFRTWMILLGCLSDSQQWDRRRIFAPVRGQPPPIRFSAHLHLDYVGG